MVSQDKNDQDGLMPRSAKIWLYLLIGAFVLVIGLMFGLVAWRDYREGSLEDAFFTLTIPIALVLFYLVDKLAEKLEKQAWTKKWPRIWKVLKDVLPILVFIPFVVVGDIDRSLPWPELLMAILSEIVIIFGIAFVLVFLFGLIKDWHQGKI